MARWYSRRSSRSAPRRDANQAAVRRPGPRRLTFEPLEDRLMLTVDWFVINTMDKEVTITLPDTTANVDVGYVEASGQNYLAVGGDRFGLNNDTIKASQVAKITILGTKTGTLDLTAITPGIFSSLSSYVQKIFVTFGVGDDPNVIKGSGCADEISGGGGDDVIYGWAGYDKLYGGAGSDVIFGDDGYWDEDEDEWIPMETSLHDVDVIEGNAGADFLFGCGGSDNISGGSGNDYISGGSGYIDYLYGNEDHDWIEGGAGNNYIDGGSGSEWMFGHDGNDTLIGGGAGDGDMDFADGGASADSIQLADGDGNDTYVYDANDELFGDLNVDWNDTPI